MHLARKQILLLIMISATLGLVSYFSCETHAQAVRTRTDGPPFLRDGKRVTGKLDLNGDAWQTYRIEVPENAISIDIEVDESIGDIDIFLRHEAEMETWDEADYTSELTANNERLRLSQWIDEFPTGVFYVDIAYRGSRRPLVERRRVDEFEFGVTYRVIVADEGKEISPRKPMRSTTHPDRAGVSYFYVDVPDDAECLRLDMLKSSHALDLYLSPLFPVRDQYRAEHFADSTASKKVLLVDKDSDPPLRPGRYYLAVHDPYGLPSSYTLRTSFSPEPPTLDGPAASIEAPESGLPHASASTVMLLLGDGTGSGSIVTPTGMILTNYHVIEDSAAGEIPEDQTIIVGVTLDPTEPVDELFKARVVDADKDHDLALLKIVSGIYDQPLPDDFHVPHVAIAPELPKLGEDLVVLGYPGIGSSTSGCYLTLTRGVVSGFDRGLEGFMIKTDADIAGGNSGGAALNEKFELIGVPTQTLDEEDSNGQIAFLVPMDNMPKQWRTDIQDELKRYEESIGKAESDVDDDSDD